MISKLIDKLYTPKYRHSDCATSDYLEQQALQRLITISACPGSHVTEQGLYSGQCIWRVK
jgi:hypothetical protein